MDALSLKEYLMTGKMSFGELQKHWNSACVAREAAIKNLIRAQAVFTIAELELSKQEDSLSRQGLLAEKQWSKQMASTKKAAVKQASKTVAKGKKMPAKKGCK